MLEEAKRVAAAKSEEREQRKQEAQEAFGTLNTSSNVAVPNYEFDTQLRVYREMEPPNPKIFMPVGFNDQELIKTIMQFVEKIPPQSASSE